MQRSPCAELLEVGPPCLSVAGTLAQNPERRIKLRVEPPIHLAEQVRWQRREIVQKSRNSAGSSEQEESEILAPSAVVAASAGRDDDTGVLSGTASCPGNHMFASEWSVGSGGRAAVDAAARLDSVLQLPMQGYLRLGSRHSAPRVTMVNGCADPGDLAAVVVRDWCQL